jgi:hypothetical protein
MTKLFKLTWNTNYGERVALVEANNKLEAILIFPAGVLWDDYTCEEIKMAGIPNIISIEGGE